MLKGADAPLADPPYILLDLCSARDGASIIKLILWGSLRGEAP
jgi:hypothetical protein